MRPTQLGVIGAVLVSLFLTARGQDYYRGLPSPRGRGGASQFLSIKNVSLPATFFGSHEPAINAMTDDLHANKHHQGAVNTANALLKTLTTLAGRYSSLSTLLMDLGTGKLGISAANETTLRNQAGSVWNHALFWRVMAPVGSSNSGRYSISSRLNTEINKAFGSLDTMLAQLNTAGQRRFGSGWSWLVWDAKASKLVVCSLPNQDNPLMASVNPSPDCATQRACLGFPIFAIDVFEHAYYLKFFQDRTAYLTSFLANIVNWTQVSKNLDAVVGSFKNFEELIGEQEKLVVNFS